jgi:hypothetical protein
MVWRARWPFERPADCSTLSSVLMFLSPFSHCTYVPKSKCRSRMILNKFQMKARLKKWPTSESTMTKSKKRLRNENVF